MAEISTLIFERIVQLKRRYMMKKYKKICAWIVAVAMVIGLMPNMQLLTTSAATETTIYESEDSTVCDSSNAKKIHTGTTNASGGKAATLYQNNYVVYTVNVTNAGTYDVIMNVAANSNPAGSTVTDVPLEISVGEGTPISYSVTNNKNYNIFTEYTVSLALEAGTNTITVNNVCEDSTIFVNLDYIKISEEIDDSETTTEDASQYPAAEGRHEAESALSYTQGSASNAYSVSESENYSGGKAIGNMNTWPNDGRAYCTTKVNATEAGTYDMVIAYAGGEANHPCNIDVRINGGDWISTLAEPTADWATVSTVSLQVELTEGVNEIDVTGACNIWYEGMGWEWINLDYFELAKSAEEATTEEPTTYGPTAAVGTVEAEEAEFIGGSIGENPAFSGGKYVEAMNQNVNGDMTQAKTLSYRVIAETSGNYKMYIHFATTSEDTKIGVKVNDGDWQIRHCQTTGSWATTAIEEAVVTLEAGENTITVTGSLDSGWIILDKFVMETTDEEPSLDPEEVVLPDTPEEGQVKKMAKELQTESLVKFRGRNLVVDDAITFDYTGSGFEFVYEGEGTIRANLTTTGTEKFAIDVDGTVRYESFNSKTGNIYLAENLANGKHTIKVYKTQEAMTGLAQLNYLMYDENATLSPTETDYKILVIGASTTCGNQMDPDTGAENGYLAFPSVISRAYNADWQQISCSGRGCTQGTLGESNWTFSQEGQLAEMYAYQSWFRDKETAYDTSSYTPDVIVTNFNNDFGSSALENGYSVDEVFTHMMTFISELRETYPNAYIVMTYGNYPNYDSDGVYSNYQIIEKYKENVDAYKTTASDDKIAFVTLPDLVNGQSNHPNEDEHQYLAELISAQISTFLDVENPLPLTHFEMENGTIVNGDDSSKFNQITTWASKFSNNAYAEGLNVDLGEEAIAEDGSNVKYVSVPVTAAKDGMYSLELNYGTTGTPDVYVRVNGGSWQKASLASTGDWAKVGQDSTISAILYEGENTVDITGATNGSYACLDRVDTIFVRDLLPEETTTEEPTTEEITTVEENTTVEEGTTVEEDTTVEEGTTVEEDTTVEEGTTVEEDTTTETPVVSDKDPIEVIGENIQAQDGAKVTIVWGQTNEQLELGQTYNVYIDGLLYGNYIGAQTISYEFATAGEHTIRITAVLGDKETEGVTLNVTVESDVPEDPTEGPTSEATRYEFEDADELVQGSASDAPSIAENEAYSNGKAVGNLNTWPDNGRAYASTSVDIAVAGTYKITVAYAGGEANHPCNIDVRVNEGEWTSILAEPTSSWTDVTTVSAEIELAEGTNVIDVTGACNIWYEGMGWEWINIDYFELELVEANVAESETPTEEPTTEPTTEAPTAEPTTEAPTAEPTTEAPTAEPTTEAPTVEPTTEAPTVEPTTEAPTVEPTTEAPTVEPTTETSTTTVTPTTATSVKVKAPARAKIKKVSAKKKSAKKVKLTLKKITNAVGYQVAIYKTKKNAKKNKKAVVKKFTKKLKVTVKSKKLKNKKKLFVKVRAYVLDGKTKVYGKWSKVKKVKIKK